MSRRTFRENSRAIRRVEQDALLTGTEPLRFDHLAAHVGVGEGYLVRAALEGVRGVYLDAIRREGEWYSTVATVLRFLAECVRDAERREDEERERQDALRRAGTVPADVTAGVGFEGMPGKPTPRPHPTGGRAGWRCPASRLPPSEEQSAGR